MTASLKIYIFREGVTFGPYPLVTVVAYFQQGRLFEHDLAYEDGQSVAQAIPLLKIIKKHGALKSTRSFFYRFARDIRQLDYNLFFPWQHIFSLQWLHDRLILLLAAVGLLPLLMISFSYQAVGYCLLACYFSMLWGMFLFLTFKTPQAKTREALQVFFITPIVAIVLLTIIQACWPWTLLYKFAGSANLLSRWMGMFFGVGISEEFCKAIAVYWMASRPGRILLPKTVMLYGMLSGLGFGIYEGVVYQLGVNRQQGVDTAYFLNVLRMTSLPFIHAIWAGISGYLIGFSMLHGRKRWALRVMAILIPALLHATYNTFSTNILGFIVALMSVILLMADLSFAQKIQTSLKNP